MKPILPFLVCSVAVLALAPGNVTAGFVTPRIPPAPAPAQPAKGGSSFTSWTVTTTADSGPGSLRQAIADAAPGDAISFSLPSPSTIALLSSLVIAKDLSVSGPGPAGLTVTRSGGTNTPNFRVFTVNGGVVALSGMTISNGRATSTTNFEDNLGGGILNWGDLTVSNCAVIGNTAPTVVSNFGFGGGIFSLGPIKVLNSTISSNTASFAGGGLCTFHSDSVLVRGCTISLNFAGIQGGGVNYQGRVAVIENSTISLNSVAPDGAGGDGLLNICFDSEADRLTLTACTITGNAGTPNGAVIFAALPVNAGQTNQMLSTLVAANAGPNFLLDGNPVLHSLGHNLDSDGTSGLINGANGDIVGTTGSPVDAKLSPLQNNGGPTFTHALLAGSPALDAAACLDANGASLPIDQRGFARPQGPACDIGAFENQPPTVTCPPPQSLPPTSPGGTTTNLTATVADPDGDALTVVWSVNGTAVFTNNVSATHPPAPVNVTATLTLGLGTNHVTVAVSDGKAATVSCSTIIRVGDTTPPTILSITATPSVLWPPDHKFVPVTITVTATDDSGSVTAGIVSVTSNQPTGGEVDWIITGNLTLLLRAERDPLIGARIYTITVAVTDPSGNTSTGTVTVTVPKSMGKPVNPLPASL